MAAEKLMPHLMKAIDKQNYLLSKRRSKKVKKLKYASFVKEKIHVSQSTSNLYIFTSK